MTYQCLTIAHFAYFPPPFPCSPTNDRPIHRNREKQPHNGHRPSNVPFCCGIGTVARHQCDRCHSHIRKSTPATLHRLCAWGGHHQTGKCAMLISPGIKTVILMGCDRVQKMKARYLEWLHRKQQLESGMNPRRIARHSANNGHESADIEKYRAPIHILRDRQFKRNNNNQVIPSE